MDKIRVIQMSNYNYKIFEMSENTKLSSIVYPAQFFYQIIQKQQYDQLDLANRDIVKQFTQFVSTLQVQIKNLIIIQRLADYGLPVLIYFKNFYRHARKNQSFIKEQRKFFSRISSIAKWATDDQNIQGIKFIHEVGSSEKQYRGPEKYQIDLQFIEFIKKLENKSRELRRKARGENGRLMRKQVQQLLAQYNEWLIKEMELNQFDQLMLQSIEKFKISNQQAETLITICQNHKNEGHPLISQFKILSSDIDKEKQTSLSQLQAQDMQPISQSSYELNESMDFYKLNNFLQSTVTQNQKNTKIQLQNKSFNIFVQGLTEISPFSRKNRNEREQAQKDKNILLRKYENERYCELTPKQEKQYKSEKNMKNEHRQEGRKKIKNKYLCCRTYLYYQQKIDEMQNQTTSYIHSSFPLKREKNDEIKKIICSFLNSNGGILYIGIVRQNNEYIVVGNQFSEGQKEEILRTFRQICQSIEPDILTHKMYNVQFVPLKESYSVNEPRQRYIPGNYVLKIVVRFGIRDQIYSYKSGCQDIFPFRSGRQIIFKEGRQLLQELNLRIYKPLGVPKPLHDHPCEKPEIGEVLNKYFQANEYSQKKPKQYVLNTEKKKQKVKQLNHKEVIIQSPVKQMTKQKLSQKKIIVHFQADIYKTPENLNKKSFNKIIQNKTDIKKEEDASRNPINKSEPGDKKKKIKEMEQSCFYISGLTKKQMMPVLQKKNLIEKVKMQESQYEETLGFIIKTHQSNIKEQIFRILQKIKEKYKERQISFDEITLEMEVQNLKSAISLLHNINISCFIVRSQSKRIIKFTYYKDSLKAFIYFRKHHNSVRYVITT